MHFSRLRCLKSPHGKYNWRGGQSYFLCLWWHLTGQWTFFYTIFLRWKPLKPVLLVGSPDSGRKMCFEKRGKLNRLFSKSYFKLVGGFGCISGYVVPGVCNYHAAIRMSLRWLPLFQGWRMRRCNWPSSVLAAQNKSSPWPLSGSHSQSMQLSWFQFRTVSHSHTDPVVLGDHPLIAINWNSLSTGQSVVLQI